MAIISILPNLKLVSVNAYLELLKKNKNLDVYFYSLNLTHKQFTGNLMVVFKKKQ